MTTEERLSTHLVEVLAELDRMKVRVAGLEAEVRRLTVVIENRDAMELRRRMLQSEGM